MYVPLLAREYLEEGKQLGFEKGELLGLEKGEHLKALKIARKMMARKMSVDVISDLTELPEDEIRKLMN